MNKKRTKYTIIVQQAYVDGKVIEAKRKESFIPQTWNITNNPIWDWSTYDYRIKEVKSIELKVGNWYLAPTWVNPLKLVAIALGDHIFDNGTGTVVLIPNHNDFSCFEEMPSKI